jgi:S1-C subfamily serine protease
MTTVSSTSEPSQTPGALLALSDGLANAIAQAEPSIVAVHARQRMSSSGVHWQGGLIVTADHTVRRDEEITITLADGQTIPAILVGRDSSTDLAVLRVQHDTLPSVTISEAGSLKVGHIVLAIARSGEGDVSASMGVISSLGGTWRTWHGGQIDQFIRPDLTLYPGASGGALLDIQGHVVGINTAGPRGMVLTIPAATICRVIDQVVKKGRVTRGYLGLGMQPVRLPDSLKTALNLSSTGGVMVVSVEPDAPADRAGVLMGDILVALDDQQVSDISNVHSTLDPDRVGKPLMAQIVRGGSLVNVTITVGERPRRDS